MTAEFEIDILGHVVRVNFDRGSVITPEMVISAMDRENELYQIEGRYDLWDFQGCQPSDDFGYDAVTRIVEHIENRYGDEWGNKTALLIEEAVQMGLSRMFQIMIDDFPTHIGIFQDQSAAMAWLKPDSPTTKDEPS